MDSKMERLQSLAGSLDGPAIGAVQWRPVSRRVEDVRRAYPAWLGWLAMGLLLRALLASNYQAAASASAGMRGVDFHVFYEAAGRLNRGEPLYGDDFSFQRQSGFYVYTPLLAEILRPLALLSFDHAVKCWFFVTSGSIILAVALYTKAAGMKLSNAMPAALLVIMAMHFWPSTFELALGNINTLILACLCGMLLSVRKESDMGVALWISLAAVLKIWPIGMALYLVMRRAWKELGICLAVTAVSIGLLFALLPSGQFMHFVASVRAMAVQPSQISQSFFGVAERHLAANPLIRPLVASPVAFRLLVGTGGLLVAGGLYTMWNAGARLDPYREQLRLNLVMTSMLLTMPVSHQVYHVLDLALIWTLLLPMRPIRHAYTTGLLALGVYLLLTVGWPTIMPVPAADSNGISSLLTSVGLPIRLALWILGMVVLRSWSTELRTKAPTRDDARPLELMDVDYACE